jgi:hypothetical protein
MKFTRDMQKTIYAMAVGYGTEGGRRPYKITSTYGWDEEIPPKGGNPGYSVGIIQVDFGQQGPAAANGFVTAVSNWAKANNMPGFSLPKADIVKMLMTKPPKWFSPADRTLFDAYLAVPANQRRFFTNYEAPIMDSNISEKRGSGKVVNDQRYSDKFAEMNDSDQIRVLTMLDKIVNQGGQGGLNKAYKVLDTISSGQFNADTIQQKFNTAFAGNRYLQRGIVQADCAGEVLAAINKSPRLSGLLQAGNGISSFDTSTVASNPELTYLSTLLKHSVAWVREEADYDILRPIRRYCNSYRKQIRLRAHSWSKMAPQSALRAKAIGSSSIRRP